MKIALPVALAALALSPSADADEPEVDDPMLAQIAPAGDLIRTWDEALDRIRRSPDLLGSEAGIERAAGQRRIALAAVLPTLVAVGSYQHAFNTASVPAGTATVQIPPPNLWTVSGVASWTLDVRAIHAVGTADREIDVSRLSVAERKRELAGAAVDGMLVTLTAERIAELDRTALRASLERLALTKTRLAFAHGIELDVDRAQQDVEAARGQLVLGDEAVRQAREALGELVGSATPIAAATNLDIEGFEQAIATTCRPTADVEHRADVAEARDRLEIAERGITDAKLRFAPTLTVGTQASDANAAAIGPTATWNASAAITVPLYDGGLRYGALRQARAELTQAREALVQTRVAAIVDAARADRSVGVAIQSRDVARRERDLAAQVDARVRQGYSAGLGTSLDLVASAQALRQADIGLATAEFQVARARAGAVLAHAECVF